MVAASAPQDHGMISLIDRQARVQVDGFLVDVSAAQSRGVLERPADREDEQILSWGNLTAHEARKVIACEQDDVCRSELLRSLEEHLARSTALVITLYYGSSYGGQ